MINIIPKERFEREVEVYQDGIHIGNVSTEGQVRYLQAQCSLSKISLELKYGDEIYTISKDGTMSDNLEGLYSISTMLIMTLYRDGSHVPKEHDLKLVKRIDEYLQTNNELETLYLKYDGE